ncbi:MAG: DUF423 domain-containing protein [Cyanobacteria bacterium P01_F01_bin.153]
MAKLFLTLAGLFGALGVALGAFGAHALKTQLDARALAIFETATRYQLIHAIAIALVAVLALQQGADEISTVLTVSGWSYCVGIALFSGSLYGLALSGAKVLGAIAPLGGTAFIVGWIALAISPWR